MTHRIVIVAAALTAWLHGVSGAQAQQADLPPGNPQTYSQIVPTTATNIWPASTYPLYKRVKAEDETILSLTSPTPTVWCAWGTVANNAAVIGSNGFALNAGFDDNGNGVDQRGLNCIQAAGATHYVYFETR